MLVEKNKNTLGLSLPDKIFGLLSTSYSWGIPFYRVCDAIWNEDMLSFEQHYKRLDRGIRRLRDEGIDVEWKEMHLLLNQNAQSKKTQVQVTLTPTRPGDLFFKNLEKEKKTNFKREDVELFFDLSKSAAVKLCAAWTEQGWIEVEKSGRSSFYKTMEI